MGFVELIKAVADRSGCSEKTARTILRSFVVETKDAVNLGERVVLPGFGVFFLHKSPSRPVFGGTRKTSGKKVKFRESRRT